MTLRPSEILLVAGEIAGALGGRPVQKIVQPDERTLLFGFPAAWLWVSLAPGAGRVHLLDEKPPGTGEAAPPFCMQLRKELSGLRFESVEPVLGERALAIDFARGPVRRRLLVFLFGAGARCVLLDEEDRPLGALPPPHAGEALPTALPPPRDLGGEHDRPSRFTTPAVSTQIAAHYVEAEAVRRVEAARTQAAAAVRREIERLRRLEEGLGRDLARIAGTTDGRRHADLLLAHLAEIPRGASEIALPDDFEGGPPITIKLDPARSAQENAARLYHEHRRLTRGRATVENRLAKARADRARAEARLTAILAATDAELGALAATARPASKTTAPSKAPKQRDAGPRPPYRAFRAQSGARILVGKGADKNDELTFHVARGNDLWLHTRDVPGAHVVVPLAGRPIDEQTLLDAATLAVWFSPARPDEALRPDAPAAVQADVTYALRKLVRKPRGAAPGRVSVAGGKTIRIRLEAVRLERLLNTREDE